MGNWPLPCLSPSPIPFCHGPVTPGAGSETRFLIRDNYRGLYGLQAAVVPPPPAMGHLSLWHLPRVSTVLPAALLTSMEGTPPPLPHVAHEV